MPDIMIGDLLVPEGRVQTSEELNLVINHKNTQRKDNTYADIISNLLDRYSTIFFTDVDFGLGIKMLSTMNNTYAKCYPQVTFVYKDPSGLRIITDLSVKEGVPLHVIRAYSSLVDQVVDWRDNDTNYDDISLPTFTKTYV